MKASDIIVCRLRCGEDNAVRSKVLCAVAGLNERELRRAVETLRRQGVPILSSNRGYYLPANIAEFDRFIERESRRARSTFLTLRAIKRLRRELALQAEFKPLTLFDGGGRGEEAESYDRA